MTLPLMDLIVLSNTRTVTDTDKREDYAVVTNLHIVFDIDKGNILQLSPIFAFGLISAFGEISLAIINCLFYLAPPPRA